VDEDGFAAEMEEQRRRARQAWKGGDEAAATELYRKVLDETGLTEFIGYEHELGRGTILAILVDGEQVERAEHGREVEVFVDRSPFYAESGGQVGDSGSMTTDSGTVAVSDTRHAVHGLHGHRGTVVAGAIRVGQEVELSIDAPRREGIRKSHTGTHVLHWALRDVLGEHVKQAGSLVEAGRLRFDFSHFSSVANAELADIDRLANRKVIENARVTTVVTTKDEAEKAGALAFFGDKYGTTVRMVEVGSYSRELCGGTHVHTSGQVGPVLVLGESSIGSNLRRVEALTGDTAYDHLLAVRGALDETAGLLRAPTRDVPERVRMLLGKVSELEDELEALRAQRRGEAAAELAGAAVDVGGAHLSVGSVPATPPEQLRQLALGVRDRIGRGVVVLGSTSDGKGLLVAAVSRDLVEEGIRAGELLVDAARALGGGGSRDPELAQAGGQQGENLEEALARASEAASRALRDR
ncbi:MAG: alanine--tRNA ligase-related protein, partial [Acidimicrobiia bacterium]